MQKKENWVSLLFLSKLKYIVFLILVVTSWGCDIIKQNWKKAKSQNTIEGYQDFLQRYPESPFDSLANSHINTLRWNEALEKNIIENYFDYVINISDSIYKQKAYQKVIELRKAIRARFLAQVLYERFKDEYHNRNTKAEVLYYSLPLRMILRPKGDGFLKSAGTTELPDPWGGSYNMAVSKDEMYVISGGVDGESPSEDDIHFPDYRETAGTPLKPLVQKGRFISKAQMREIIRRNDFYDSIMNEKGQGIANSYEKKVALLDTLIYDNATSLSWQSIGSEFEIDTKMEAFLYVSYLNAINYGNRNDWRLPTMDEALTLVESSKNSLGFYVQKEFNKFSWQHAFIWTSDQLNDSDNWFTNFWSAFVTTMERGGRAYTHVIAVSKE